MPSINLIKASDGTGNAATATVQSPRSPGASTILVDTVDNIPTSFMGTMGTPHTFTDPITSEVITVISEATAVDFTGHVDSTHLEIDSIAPGYTDNGSSVGDIVIIKPTTEWANNIAEVLDVSLNDDGTLKAVTESPGWTALAYTPNTVTYNGNRSYTCAYNSVDLTGAISNGMRLRHTRTVAAPTQCTSLNGSTQYYSKTSPAGMTFTDDFVVSAWVKLSSYPGSLGAIVSRYNGTNGWQFLVRSTGQILLVGFNASSSNFRQFTTYQSLPLNKWVHVSFQLDMSAFTATATTCYATIDGVDVPIFSDQGGTNPTALVQAGNLEVGSANGGTNLFPGKIAQVAIYNSKVTQATILASISQGLAGTETSLISAYSFNNTINDLNTSNANNLTANGSAVATSADSPFGGQADGSISSTLDYAIIQKAVFSTNTTLTVQVPEGCTIPTSGGVNSVVYSSNKAPYGMPVQRTKWRLSSILGIVGTTTSNATYGSFISGGFALTVPLGSWVVGYQAPLFSGSTIPVTFNLSPTPLTGLSLTSGAAASRYSAVIISATAGATTEAYAHIEAPQDLSTASIYVMYTFGATTSAGIDTPNGAGEIFAENGYL